MKRYLALYGSVKMIRVYCSECKGMTLVIDGIKQCCDRLINKNPKKIMRMCIGQDRKKPSMVIQRKILELQNNKCLYCGKEFGSLYMRNGKILKTKLHFDHLVPYSYSQENKYNFVAACHICNGLKSNKMFDTMEELIVYLDYNRKKKGIEFL